MSSKTSNRGQRPAALDARNKVAAKRLAAQQARRRTVMIRAAVGGGAVVILGAVVVLATATGHDPMKQTGVTPAAAAAAAASGAAGLPPWPNAADPSAAILAAGLHTAGSEGTAEHYHAHLDVIVDGLPVTVTSQIGIDNTARQISPLHTHDATGLIHIESPTIGQPYYLGQLFREWNVALTANQLGGLHTDASDTLTAYVDGKPFAGDPASIRLISHQEITLVYGTAAQHPTIPASYHFPAGT
jgi:hypothetical protein